MNIRPIRIFVQTYKRADSYDSINPLQSSTSLCWNKINYRKIIIVYTIALDATLSHEALSMFIEMLKNTMCDKRKYFMPQLPNYS